MSYYQRFAPPLGSMQLIVWLAVFIVLPAFWAPTGLKFALLTLAFIVGIQPHINKLSEEGHQLHFALNKAKFRRWTLWQRHDFYVRFHISDKKLSNSVATSLALLFTFLFLPGILYIVYKATGILTERLDARWETISTSLSDGLDWLRTLAPRLVPEGDFSSVFGGIFADVFGSIKHVAAEVSTEVAALVAHVVKAWFEIIISMILLGVLVQGWVKETDNLKWRIETGITNKKLARRTFLFGRLYQDCLSILIAGYIEVALTLSVYYFMVMMVLPLNLGLFFSVTTALFFGFVTAIPKIGGIAIKLTSPFIAILLFPDGFGYLGFELFSISLGVDLLIKALLMFAAAFFGGYLEAYEYTPEKIGKKLGITKMEMVMTVLIWAIGAGFMGMIYGVLIMLLVPTFTKLLKEESRSEDMA